MSYANNRSSYNTRNSTGGRYNTTGQFVPAASEQQPQLPPNNTMVQTTTLPQRLQNAAGNGASQNNQFSQLYPPAAPQQKTNQLLQTADVKMEEANDKTTPEDAAKPGWMKSKLAGVKKISNKERRRRQNETLRRLLTPKNALMVLNEMMPGEVVANQFKVEPSPTPQYFNKNSSSSFCADLTVEGNNYKGYGENKMTARNAAAEQAIRDYIIKRMAKVMGGASDTASVVSAGGESVDGEEEALPMIQLASFALHKLFSEWEYEGHKVPQLKPPSGPVSKEDDLIASNDDTLSLDELQSLVDLEALATLQHQDADLAEHLTAETALRLAQVNVPASGVVLYCDVSTPTPRPFVPLPLRRHVFDSLHALSHPGPKAATKLARQHKLITQHFVWPLMRKNCREWAMACLTCQQSKAPADTAMAVDGAGAGAAAAGAGAAPKPKPAKPKTLPLNASALHPAMLLTYMRPRLEYKELAVDGDKPQAMMYTIGVDVDGLTYIGKASNKKEARRAAAKAACNALFNVTFDDVATAVAPITS